MFDKLLEVNFAPSAFSDKYFKHMAQSFIIWKWNAKYNKPLIWTMYLYHLFVCFQFILPQESLF